MSVIWSVTMTVRFHLFPFRTQKLSSLVPKIVRWKRRVKIGSRRLLYGPLVKRLRQRPLTPLTSVRFRYGSPYAPLAQLVEQLTLNQWAQGSSPWRCTTKSTRQKCLVLFLLFFQKVKRLPPEGHSQSGSLFLFVAPSCRHRPLKPSSHGSSSYF